MTAPERTSPDFEEANRFLQALAGGSDVSHTWQTFDDNQERDMVALKGVRHGTLKELWRGLVGANKRGAGVHVTVNLTDDSGKRQTENIIAPRAVFMDFDGVEPIGNWAVEPSMVVRSRNGVHVYWLLHPTADLDTWLHMQAVLAEIFGSDKEMAKVATTIRVPGFMHNKQDPFFVGFEKFELNLRYELSELVGAFGIASLINEASEERRKGLERAKKEPKGGVSSYPDRLERALSCLDTCSTPTSGRNSFIAKEVVPIGYKFGIGSQGDHEAWADEVVSWAHARGVIASDFREREVRSIVRSVWKAMASKVGFGTMLDRDSPEWIAKGEAYDRKMRDRQAREDAGWAASLEYGEEQASARRQRPVSTGRPFDEVPDSLLESVPLFDSPPGDFNEPPRVQANRAAEAGLGFGAAGPGPGNDGRLNFPGVKFTPLADFKYRALNSAPDGHPLTVRGNSGRFLDDYANGVRFCEPLKSWFLWTGSHWRADRSSGVMTLGQQTAAKIHRLMDHSDLSLDPKLMLDKDDQAHRQSMRAELRSWTRTSEKPSAIREMVEYASWQQQVQVESDELDCDDLLVNTPSGVVNVKTMEVQAHDPRLNQTKITTVPYEAKAECPRWIQFVNWAMKGDQELISFLQRAGGYSLTGSCSDEVFFICYGGGGNGKSTFLEALLNVAGTYGRTCDFQLFLAGAAQQSGPTPELLALKDIRMTFASEPEEGRRLKEDVVKRVTGGERITARGLWSQPVEFKPKFSLWFGTNHKPTIKGTDDGIWRRVALIPWEQKVTAETKDVHLKDKLRAEYPGILAWFLQGANDWANKGLRIPDKIRAATSEYRDDMDVIGDFITSTCIVHPDRLKYFTASQELYDEYVKWCESTRERPLKRKAFGMRLHGRGFQSEKKAGRMHYIGIGIKSDHTQDVLDQVEFEDSDNGRYPD